MVQKQDAGPAETSGLFNLCEVTKCSKVNRRQKKSVTRSTKKTKSTKGAAVQWHYEAFNDLLNVYLTCSNCRLVWPRLHHSYSHSSAPKLALFSFGEVWKNMEGRMRYPGDKLTRCLNHFCRLRLTQRRKRLFSEHPSTIWALTSEYHYPVHVHFSETRPHLELFSADLPPIVLFRLSPGCILFSSQEGEFFSRVSIAM